MVSLTFSLSIHMLMVLLFAQFFDFLDVPLNLSEIDIMILLVLLQIIRPFHVSEHQSRYLFECKVGITRK